MRFFFQQPENLSQDGTSQANSTDSIKVEPASTNNSDQSPAVAQRPIKQEKDENSCQNSDNSVKTQIREIDSKTGVALVVPSVPCNGDTGKAVHGSVQPPLAPVGPSCSPPALVIQPRSVTPKSDASDQLSATPAATLNGVFLTQSKAVHTLAINSNSTQCGEGEEAQAQAIDLSTVPQSRAPTLTGQTVQLANKVSGTIEAPQNVTITSGLEPKQPNNLPKTITATTIKVPQIPVAKNNNDSATATLNLNFDTEEETDKTTS